MSQKIRYRGSKVLVSGVDFLVERGGDSSSKITTRYNPMFDEFKSLADLIEFEEKGSNKVKTINHENISLVTEAIDALPSTEKEFLKLHYFQGLGIDEMSLRSGIIRSRLYYIKKKATTRFKIELEKRTGKKPGTIFKDCVICSSKIDRDINKYIIRWLETNSWHFRGILKALRTEFNIYAPSLSVVVSHIQFHMNVDKKKVFQKLNMKYQSLGEVIENTEEGPKVNLNVPISLAIKREIEQLAEDYGRNVSEIVRLLVRMGVKPLKTILEAQNELYAEALIISKELYKLKSLKDVSL